MQGFTAGQQGTPLPRHIALEDPRAAFPGVPERERPHGSCGRAALLFEPRGRRPAPRLSTPPRKGQLSMAKEFTDEINATFEEVKKMGMVLGPFTQQEAAEACECTPDQLCPGPMAGIQESDKVRTILDGSWGGANTHIQANTTERTTAPTVMDCVQAGSLHSSRLRGGGLVRWLDATD